MDKVSSGETKENINIATLVELLLEHRKFLTISFYMTRILESHQPSGERKTCKSGV